MESRARLTSYLLVSALAPALAFVTGCAEEDAEGREAAYPVGASVPPSPAPPTPPMPPGQMPAPSQPAPAPGSAEVRVGEDSDAPAAVAGEYADSDPSALTDFRSTLDPYGTWTEDPTYGTVWVPSQEVVGDDFAPYQTAGHWAYDDDYVWVSDYSWGWAPFHYGRWVYAGGWEWIPGRRYAGAWVSWRYGWDDWAYVGWAPLAPTWCWHRGIAVGIGFVPRAPYGFVATGDLFAGRLATHVVVGERVGLIAAHTRPWVPASPAVAGHVIAQPAVGGPPPGTMRIPASAVVGVSSNQGVAQARAFARPSVAATASYSRAGAAPTFSTGSRAVAASYPRSTGMAPAYGPPAPSHFGGKLGAGFSGAGVTSAWSPTRASPSTTAAARPTFASAQHVTAAPAYHGFSTGASTATGASTGGFHGAGGYSGGFHGSGVSSGGGFHGGGGFHSGGGGGGGGGHGGGGHGGGHR